MLAALRRFGFPEQYVSWIVEYVTTVTYSVSINGSMYGFSEGKKGLRQEDPLSPFLFGLCLEIFSRKLKIAAMSPTFYYHLMCIDTCITHLAYAGWSPLICAGEWIYHLRDSGLPQGLQRDGGATPQPSQIPSYCYRNTNTHNRHPSVTYWISARIIPFLLPWYSNCHGEASEELLWSLIEKIMKKVASWPKHILSYAGKLELVRTVLQSIEYFWLSILSVCEIIEKIYVICRSSIWSTKYPPISWVAMIRPSWPPHVELSPLGAFIMEYLAEKRLLRCVGSIINTSI